MPRTLLVIAALALSGCASGPLWSKSGVTDDTARADYAECRAMGQDATRRDTDINTDILASRGHDWANDGTLHIHEDVMAVRPVQTQDAVVGLCMSSKGYDLRQ